MNLKKCCRNYQDVIAEQGCIESFYLTNMTALSLKAVDSYRNQTKLAHLPCKPFACVISVGCDTDLYDKNSFNNHLFDSAVFSEARNFKRQKL
jgi:hypothetical protein